MKKYLALIITAFSLCNLFAQTNELYIIGSATPVGWDIANAIKLVQNPEKTTEFSYTGILKAGEFKFPVNRQADWQQDMYMKVASDATKIYLHYGGDPDDNKWNITTVGNYTIVVDIQDLTISIKNSDEIISELYMIGTATPVDWDIANAIKLHKSMNTVNEFSYNGTLKAGTFKFPVTRQTDWQQDMYLKDPSDSTQMYLHHGGDTDDSQWKITQPGNYQILLNVENLTIDIQYIPENPYKAPLYWTVYEKLWVGEQNEGHVGMSMTMEDWDQEIDWIAENLKPYGYDMLCTDGFISMSSTDASGYMTQYGGVDLSALIAKLDAKGLKLGVYDNPLWIHGPLSTPIEGTDKTFGDLLYIAALDAGDVLYPNNTGAGFTWAVPSHEGAKEYIDGFFKHYKNMGVDFIRMDFLCLFESGFFAEDQTPVGKGYGRENYTMAMEYIYEAANKYGIFTSMVMPNLYDNAILEQKYGNMVRIVADVFWGGFDHLSDRYRGTIVNGWPNAHNQFDGFVHWSPIGGRGKVILDGDFTRLNTFSNEDEKEFSISLQLMAGGPIAIADQWNTIGGNLRYYQNEELLALNTDGFVGKPLSFDIADSKSQIWKGQMTNGDWIVGLFNREGDAHIRAFDFQTELGLAQGFVRDLWSHTDLGELTSLSEDIPSHGCRIFRISTDVNTVYSPTFSVEGGIYAGAQTITISTTTDGASIYYTTDGSDPNPTSSLYSNPIEVASSQTLKAVAVKTSMVDSYVSKAIYYIGEAPTQGGMYLGGTFNNWNLPNNGMKLMGDNQWSLKVYIEAGEHEMKFANQNNWRGDDWGNALGLSGTAELTTGGDPNITFTALENGNYIIQFNDYTLEYSIEKTLDKNQDQMYVAGTFSGWNLSANPMTFIGDFLWESSPITMAPGNYELKFANTSNWTGDDWGNTIGLSGIAKLSTGGDPNISFTITEEGNYIIRFNDQTLAYSISDQATGIDELDASQISVYPNPASEKLFINLGTAKSASICLYRVDGSIVYQNEVQGPLAQIDLNKVGVAGMILIKVTGSNSSEIFKVMVR